MDSSLGSPEPVFYPMRGGGPTNVGGEAVQQFSDYGDVWTDTRRPSGDELYDYKDDDLWSQSDEAYLTDEGTVSNHGATQPRSGPDRFSCHGKLRMLSLRRHLDGLSDEVTKEERFVQTTKEELRSCRETVTALEREQDEIYSQIELSIGAVKTADVYRLESKHQKVCVELEAERDLEMKIMERLAAAELDLSRADLERGKFLLAETELEDEEIRLAAKGSGNAAARAEKEKQRANQAVTRLQGTERDHFKALKERDCKKRQAISAANKSKENVSKYIHETLNKANQKKGLEDERTRKHMEKRVNTLLNLKADINANRDNLKALQARNRHQEQKAKQGEIQEMRELKESGQNVQEVMLQKRKLQQMEEKKRSFHASQHQNQAALMASILEEEKQMKRRQEMYPQLFPDPKRNKALNVAPLKEKPVKMLQEMVVLPEDNRDTGGDSVKEERDGSPDEEVSPAAEMEDSSDDDGAYDGYGAARDAMVEGTTGEGILTEELAQPEFEGLWNKAHKSYQVPKEDEPPYTLNYPSKMEREIMAAALEKQRAGIVRKQVAAGREFKGQPFVSKPDVVHFKDFDIGEAYKKKVVLTNVSYSINFLKLIDLSEHLKDFVHLEFEPPGQMSAGMSCEMLVTFNSVINADLHGEIQFLAQTGPFNVPMKCTIKKCDVSVDTDCIDFGVQVRGEILRRHITLINKGAKGTTFEFLKITGTKQPTILSVGTSFGRMTTAEESIKPDSAPAGEKITPQTERRSKQTVKMIEESPQEAEEDGPLVVNPQEDQDGPQNTEDESKEDSDLTEEAITTPVVCFEEEENVCNLDGMRLGELTGGEIGPFSSVKLEINYQPTVPGKVDVDFELRFTDEDSDNKKDLAYTDIQEKLSDTIEQLETALLVPGKFTRQRDEVIARMTAAGVSLKNPVDGDGFKLNIPIRALASAIDVPVWVERQNVDLKICLFDRLYQDAIVINNRATSALRLTMGVCKELRNNLELLPKTAYIQAQSQFSVQMKFLPRHSLVEDTAGCFDKETGVLEAPMTIRVADQTALVPFTVHAVVTSSDLEFDQSELDFGFCTIHESVTYTVRLTNKSILPQKYGFVGSPEYVTVQPNDGFGTLLPSETIPIDIIFSAEKAEDYSFELTCKSGINRDFKLPCRAVGVHTPLELSHSVIHFGATAVGDSSFASFKVINSHTDANEFTHSVPRVGKGPVMPVGPTSFEFMVPDGAPICVYPSVGTVKPGMKTNISIKFSPDLMGNDVREEAVRVSTKTLEAKARQEYEEGEAARKNAQDPLEKNSKKGAKKPKSPAAKVKASRSSSGPKPVVPPKPEDISTESDDYSAGRSSLLRQFPERFSSYTIPCFVALGVPGDSGTLPYDANNTLYIHVHCPEVKPSLVVISDHGRTVTDFGEVSIGQRVVKTITLQNISDSASALKQSVLDCHGPFQVLNASRNLAPDATHTLVVAFEPKQPKSFYEVLDIKCTSSTLSIVLRGEGLDPLVKLSIVDGILDMGYVLAGEEHTENVELENSSTFAIDYRIILDSLKACRTVHRSGLPDSIESPKHSERHNFGPANHSGRSVFDCIPCEGTLQPGKKATIAVTFHPDHPSDLYADVARIELFGRQEVLQLKGVAKTKIMYVTGGDDIAPRVESLCITPAMENNDVPQNNPVPVLLTFRALSNGETTQPAMREIYVGCVRTMAVSQKKNGEFFFDNLNTITALGFQIEPVKGFVDAGNNKKVTVTWTPPKGHDANVPLRTNIILSLKGDVLEQYNILLHCLVVTRE